MNHSKLVSSRALMLARSLRSSLVSGAAASLVLLACGAPAELDLGEDSSALNGDPSEQPTGEGHVTIDSPCGVVVETSPPPTGARDISAGAGGDPAPSGGTSQPPPPTGSRTPTAFPGQPCSVENDPPTAVPSEDISPEPSADPDWVSPAHDEE
jgi:hypothetical protein